MAQGATDFVKSTTLMLRHNCNRKHGGQGKRRGRKFRTSPFGWVSIEDIVKDTKEQHPHLTVTYGLVLGAFFHDIHTKPTIRTHIDRRASSSSAPAGADESGKARTQFLKDRWPTYMPFTLNLPHL